MGVLASTLDAWMRMQGLVPAESLYLLSGLMVATIETLWEDENNRPRQFTAVMKALDEAGFVLGGLITLIKAGPNELPE